MISETKFVLKEVNVPRPEAPRLRRGIQLHDDYHDRDGAGWYSIEPNVFAIWGGTAVYDLINYFRNYYSSVDFSAPSFLCLKMFQIYFNTLLLYVLKLKCRNRRVQIMCVQTRYCSLRTTCPLSWWKRTQGIQDTASWWLWHIKSVHIYATWYGVIPPNTMYILFTALMNIDGDFLLYSELSSIPRSITNTRICIFNLES